MKPDITFCVYGLPRPAGSKRAFAIRKNGQPTGRIAVVDACKESREWKSIVAGEAVEAMEESRGQMFLEPVRLCVTFRLPRPKSHYGTGKHSDELRPSAPSFPAIKPDLLKLTRAVEDALTGIVWRDDSQVVSQCLDKKYDKYPGCTIQVSEVCDD
ncbi:MAG TPA: RusA family crossover junction endodeoxyribonuclease [Verrucomicrobiae bacterium]|nr:RusA family crossover junction endodeoxyribonuclease [Verrucomicrobiae bacterium]